MKVTKKVLENGNISYVNERGEWHREDGPARITNNGKYSSWFINDRYHRIDGPARLWKSDLGEIIHEEFYLNGVHYKDKSDWEHEVVILKLKNYGKEL